MTTKQHDSSRTANTLLACGAVIGFLLAGTSVLEPETSLDSSELARVNQQRIGKQEFLDSLQLIQRERRQVLDAEQRQQVLQGLIDEKLLIGQGLVLGLPYADNQLRQNLLRSMIDTITQQSYSAAIDESTLRSFYEEHRDYFALPVRLQLRQMYFQSSASMAAEQQANEAHRALLAGQHWDAVAERWASPALAPLPDAPLPPSKLQQYLGASLPEQLLALAEGAVSKPLAYGDNYRLFWLVKKQAAQYRPFEEVAAQVDNEYRRRQAEQALADYLQQLRQGADIQIDQAFLQRLAQE